MKKRKKVLFISFVLLLSAAAAGCAPNFQGTYSGSGMMTSPAAMGGQPTSSTFTIVIGSANNNYVSGSISGTLSGSFTGTAAGNVISNVNLTATSTMTNGAYGYGTPGAAGAYGGYSSYGGYSAYGSSSSMYCASGTFIGTLTLNNHQLTGNLTNNGTMSSYGMNCSGTTITINATKTN